VSLKKKLSPELLCPKKERKKERRKERKKERQLSHV